MGDVYVVNKTDMTAIADAIRTKGGTSDALAFPGGFVDAVGAIQAGSGGGGNAIQIGQSSPWGILTLFDVLEKGTAVTGEFTVAGYLPAGEQLVFSTGLEAVNGLFVVDTDWQRDERSGEYTVFSLWMRKEESKHMTVWYLNTNGGGASKGETPNFARCSSIKLENGSLYVTPQYGGNSNYTPFEKNHRIMWIAW